jgi:CRISPR-associated protein Cmr6
MTQLVRNALKSMTPPATVHPGLLLQRGFPVYHPEATQRGEAKVAHLDRIYGSSTGNFYQHSYDRWKKSTADTTRFTQTIMKIEGRLLIGLTGGGALETGCAVSHTYGTPYLPGSNIKGVIRAWAEENMPEWKAQFNDLFGTTNLSGLVAFHDAWWVPESGGAGHKNQPFAADIVTPHHPEYYKGQGVPATDLDSPVPNALIGVRGSFLFVIEGDAAWRGLAGKMLVKALGDWGIGAKTRAGYGYLTDDKDANQRLALEAAQAERAAMPVTERLKAEAKALTEKQIADKFGTDFNKTRETFGEDFEFFANLVRNMHAVVIESWKTETKKTNKARFRAYRFFSGATNEE